MEDWVKHGTLLLATAVEVGAGVIIALATAEALIGVLRLVARRGGEATTDSVRIRLGRWLALALEFTLAADILRTAIAPSWNEIGQLAAIVVLRTALNYFLQREIEHAERRDRR